MKLDKLIGNNYQKIKKNSHRQHKTGIVVENVNFCNPFEFNKLIEKSKSERMPFTSLLSFPLQLCSVR